MSTKLEEQVAEFRKQMEAWPEDGQRAFVARARAHTEYIRKCAENYRARLAARDTDTGGA